jgi:hypothetical protein
MTHTLTANPRTYASPRHAAARKIGLEALYSSWWVFAATAAGLCLALGAAIWLSAQLHAGPVLREAALFGHLSSLVVGFGAVLIADYFVLVWLLRRATFAEVLAAISRLHVPIWAGLSGLVISGALLAPDLAAWPARVKLGLVLVLTINGLQAMVLGHRMNGLDKPTPRLLAWGAASTTISQLCWWGAVWIGFWNTTEIR